LADLTVAFPDGTATTLDGCTDWDFDTRLEYDPDDPPKVTAFTFTLGAATEADFECNFALVQEGVCGPGYYDEGDDTSSTTMVLMDCSGVGDDYKYSFSATEGYLRIDTIDAGPESGSFAGEPLSITLDAYLHVRTSEGIELSGELSLGLTQIAPDGEDSAACAGCDGDEDGDGVVATYFDGDDCDDLDETLGTISDDGDCDGVLIGDDCDDSDVSMPTDDGDCDGTPTAADCDDTDAEPTVVAEDGDCDSVLTADDCDDSDAESTVVAEDGDCDGSLTADDCEDDDPTILPGVLDDCDGTDSDCDGVIDDDAKWDDPYEPNDTEASAYFIGDMDMGEGGFVSAFIHNESDLDVFTFDYEPSFSWPALGGLQFVLYGVPHGVTYRMDLTYPSGDTETEFSDAGGSLVLELGGEFDSEAGMYFVSISTLGGADCSESYDLSVEWFISW